MNILDFGLNKIFKNTSFKVGAKVRVANYGGDTYFKFIGDTGIIVRELIDDELWQVKLNNVDQFPTMFSISELELC